MSSELLLFEQGAGPDDPIVAPTNFMIFCDSIANLKMQCVVLTVDQSGAQRKTC